MMIDSHFFSLVLLICLVSHLNDVECVKAHRQEQNRRHKSSPKREFYDIHNSTSSSSGHDVSLKTTGGGDKKVGIYKSSGLVGESTTFTCSLELNATTLNKNYDYRVHFAFNYCPSSLKKISIFLSFKSCCGPKRATTAKTTIRCSSTTSV